MNDYKDVENFQNTAKIIDGEKPLEDPEINLNDIDISEWDLVKVPIKHEFINELTEMIKYEWRYRLYLSKVLKLQGFDSFIADQYSCCYWEKDEDGNIVDCYMP